MPSWRIETRTHNRRNSSPTSETGQWKSTELTEEPDSLVKLRYRENESYGGYPVHVHYVGTGDKIIVDRVILDED
jgi:hypothetical protein